ncbi:MAG: PP2C family protein-serine/threonine phosphatase [Acidobacteriota bacterium]
MGNEENNIEINKLKTENENLKGAVTELSILNEIAIAVSSTLSLERILNLIIEKCIKHLKIEQAAVMLLDEKDKGAPFHTLIRRGDSKADKMPYRLDSQLAGWMLINKKPLIINDFEKDKLFRKKGDAIFKIKSMACVPLIAKGQMIGLIVLFNKMSEQGFGENDKRMLSIITTQSAQVIENARLLEEEKALFSIQEELRLAYNIQMNLLPKEPPAIPGYDIVGKSIPAKEVGGDYFDFIKITENKLAFCLGDISGKGLPAAILMSNLQATVHGQAILKSNIKEWLGHCNTLMYRNSDPERFSTFFLGILDFKKDFICYSNAGHNYPLFFSSDKKPEKLERGGIVLGCLEDYPFSEERIKMEQEDLLLIYSDGITEAINEKDEEFGESRLSDIVLSNRKDSSVELIDKIINSVYSYAGNLKQMDDMTLVLIKKTNNSG